MRWLLIGLLISVAALLIVAGAAARHIWQQRRRLATDSEAEAGQKSKPEPNSGENI